MGQPAELGFREEVNWRGGEQGPGNGVTEMELERRRGETAWDWLGEDTSQGPLEHCLVSPISLCLCLCVGGHVSEP